MLEHLSESMPHRVQAIIKSNGWYCILSISGMVLEFMEFYGWQKIRQKMRRSIGGQILLRCHCTSAQV